MLLSSWFMFDSVFWQGNQCHARFVLRLRISLKQRILHAITYTMKYVLVLNRKIKVDKTLKKNQTIWQGSRWLTLWLVMFKYLYVHQVVWDCHWSFSECQISGSFHNIVIKSDNTLNLDSIESFSSLSAITIHNPNFYVTIFLSRSGQSPTTFLIFRPLSFSPMTQTHTQLGGFSFFFLSIIRNLVLNCLSVIILHFLSNFFFWTP